MNNLEMINIWISIILVCIFVFISILVLQNRSTSSKRIHQAKTLYLLNDTDINTTVKLKDIHIDLLPDKDVKIVLSEAEEIKANGHKFIFSDPNIKQIIITTDGIDSDLTATPRTSLTNTSNKSIILVYTDKFRKIHHIEIAPYSTIKGPTIRKKQKWNVYNTDKSLIVSSLPKRKIVWDGYQLK